MNPQCPACRTATEIVRWDDIAGFECRNCDGHCIRPDALQAFLLEHSRQLSFAQLMELARDAPPSPRPLECPDCRTATFHTLRAGLVQIDVCSICIGVYFDKHEATIYLQQARARAAAGKVVSGAVNGIDALGAIVDIMGKFLH